MDFISYHLFAGHQQHGKILIFLLLRPFTFFFGRKVKNKSKVHLIEVMSVNREELVTKYGNISTG